MPEALTVDELRADFEHSKRMHLTRPRFSTEEIGTLFAEIDRLRADLAQAMAERGRALTVADALEQQAGRAIPAPQPLDYRALIDAAYSLHGYEQGTYKCVAFKHGAEWAIGIPAR